MLSHRKGVLLDGIGSELVRSASGGRRKTLSTWLASIAAFNVKDYGATGDGTTNDTTAISAAITAAGTGGAVYFPEGVYIFSTVLTQLSGQRWFGDGSAVSILRLAASVTSIAVCVTAADFAENYSIENLQIDGNRENITPATDLYNTFYLVRGPRGGKGGAYRNLLLANSWGRVLQTSNESVSEYADGIIVENVRVTNAGTKAISATRSKRVTITGCVVEVDPYTSADHAGGVGDGNAGSGSCFECNEAIDVVIVGNHGVQIGASIAAPGIRIINGSTDVKAFGNTIEGASYLGFIQNADGTRFFANTGRDIRGNGVFVGDSDVENPTDTCKRVYVYNNTLIDCDDAYVFVTANKSGLNAYVEVYIHHNNFIQVSGTPTYGIYNAGVSSPAIGGECLVYEWGNTYTGTIPNHLAGPAAAEILPEPLDRLWATSTVNSTHAIHAINTADNATVLALRLEGNRATPTTNDSVGLSYVLSDSAGNQDEFARISGRAIDVTSASEDGALDIQIVAAGALANRYYLDSTVFRPASAGAANLGSASIPFGSLLLNSGGSINWNNGDVTLTHGSNALAGAGGQLTWTYDGAATTAPIVTINTTDNATVAGIRIEGDRATPANGDIVYAAFVMSDSAGNQTEYARISGWASTVTDASEVGRIRFDTLSGGTLTTRMILFNSSLYPNANDGIALGQASLGFSDLFLASGAVIGFNNGNLTLTHAAGQITNSGAWINTGNMTHSGAVIEGVQSLSGAGAVNLTTPVTAYTSTGVAQALTLADGVVGQLKRIVHVVDGGSGVLTPTNLAGGATITFTNAAESATLQFLGTKWHVIALQGAVLA